MRPPHAPTRASRLQRTPRLGVCVLLIALCGGWGCGASAAARPAAPPPRAAGADTPSTLILLSFDGWRWDYHTKAPTPNLRRLMARGVRAERLIPVFPTKTFPNHYTIVTGLYPVHHGIVGNTMRDPSTGLRFSLGDRKMMGDTRWWAGEPLWVTATRQGRRSATLFWPGSEAEIAGMRPDYWLPYDGTLPNEARVDRILAWLDLPAAERPAFITGYFNDADDAGHVWGPESRAVRDAIARLDVLLGRLVRGLEARQLLDRVNIVVVSDHGMAGRRADRVIALADYLDLDTVEIVEIDPHLTLNVRGASVEDVYRRLARAHPHLRVYRRDQTPEHWRFRGHPRIPAIVGMSDEGWILAARRPAVAAAPGRTSGNHGYDPRVRAMHGLFVAAGPAFRRGATAPPFETVHVYTALAGALGVTPAPNDGDPRVAERLMSAPD